MFSLSILTSANIASKETSSFCPKNLLNSISPKLLIHQFSLNPNPVLSPSAAAPRRGGELPARQLSVTRKEILNSYSSLLFCTDHWLLFLDHSARPHMVDYFCLSAGMCGGFSRRNGIPSM